MRSVCERLAIPRDRIVSLGARDYPGQLRCVPGLARLIEMNRIQVVHSHLFPAHLVGWLAARAAGVEATVVTEQSILHPEKTPTERLLERAVVARAGQLVAVSRAVRDARARQLGVAPDRFLVIPNSVPIARLPRLRTEFRAQKRKELGISGDEVVVMTVGRFEPGRGKANAAFGQAETWSRILQTGAGRKTPQFHLPPPFVQADEARTIVRAQ